MPNKRSVEFCSFILISPIIFFVKQIESQTFVRSCSDPNVEEHLPGTGHTFCSHACRGAFMDVPMDMCAANGDCVCTPPCSDDPAVLGAPLMGPMSDICPPNADDPPDTDATALPGCMTRCMTMCGGMAAICGDTILYGPAMDMVAKVCACVCPRKACTATTDPPTMVPPTASPGPPTMVPPTMAPPSRPPRKLWLIRFFSRLRDNLPLLNRLLTQLLSLYIMKEYLWKLHAEHGWENAYGKKAKN